MSPQVLTSLLPGLLLMATLRRSLAPELTLTSRVVLLHTIRGTACEWLLTCTASGGASSVVVFSFHAVLETTFRRLLPPSLSLSRLANHFLISLANSQVAARQSETGVEAISEVSLSKGRTKTTKRWKRTQKAVCKPDPLWVACDDVN